MKKEIGSIFPLSDSELRVAESEQAIFAEDRIYYSLCREALYDIASTYKARMKVVLIPAFTCQTVITPFEEAGWKCEYFSINRDLRIDIESLRTAIAKYQPSLLVVHPYFGMDLNNEECDALVSIKANGVVIILDLTQCLFSKQDYPFADYVVASYRKWMPIPDGGYLVQKKSTNILQPDKENSEFTDREIAAMYLRGQYFANEEQRTKGISIRISKAADILAENNITPHKMSQVAYNLMMKEDTEYNQNRRFANYSYLSDNIQESNRVSKVCRVLSRVTTAPLYFTIYVDDRRALQKLLAEESCYAPVIWPVEDERVLISDEVKYIYEHLLAIACDQRYVEADMSRVVNVINSFSNERKDSSYWSE